MRDEKNIDIMRSEVMMSEGSYEGFFILGNIVTPEIYLKFKPRIDKHLCIRFNIGYR
jgi:hypothetical protein